MKKLFLHGFMGRGADWNIQSGLTPDLPCFGDNLNYPKTRDELFENLYRRFVDEYGIGKDDVIIGYSLGGRVAMELVYKMGLPVKYCLILCAHPGLRTDRERKERDLMEAGWIEQLGDREEFLSRWYKNELFQELVRSNAFSELYERRIADNGEGWGKSFDYYSLALQPDLRPYIGDSDIPLNYIVGENDHKFLAIAEDLKKEIPRTQVTKLAGIDHGIPWLYDIDLLVEEVIRNRE